MVDYAFYITRCIGFVAPRLVFRALIVYTLTLQVQYTFRTPVLKVLRQCPALSHLTGAVHFSPTCVQSLAKCPLTEAV